ncbi:hypothetical protein [Achromobacter phage Motura]|uniref:Uncharacterized protein n=1 Tax=Achromobacter phage Motura TaxID=2591403 RepID=A0A514CSV2_9CAUD|nr:hypothetical protein H1O15_gp237 [Achromobacter phage Motura]QDH83551.1 hypothetical protein [Achromobacter phage Motura]
MQLIHGVRGSVPSITGYWIAADGTVYSLNKGAYHSRLLAEIEASEAAADGVDFTHALIDLEDFVARMQTDKGWIRVNSRYDEFTVTVDANEAKLPKAQVEALNDLINIHNNQERLVFNENRARLGRRFIQQLRDQCVT